MKKRRILYAVLNWGLGHATRSLPLIRELVKEHDVIILSTGRSLELLRSEISGAEFIDHEDYSVRYTKKGWSLLVSLFFQIPKILIKLRQEHRFTEELVRKLNIDRIISDNRYGIYSREVPSFFITHQLRFRLPGQLRHFEILSVVFNRMYFRRYRKIFVPDEKDGLNLSGELSHNVPFMKSSKIEYCGILADISGSNEIIRSDYLFIISGPEPQRTIFERKVLEQSKELEGKIIIVRGVTENKDITEEGGRTVYSSVEREKLSSMIKGAELIISRPGYSSVMEFAALGKKALFVPTPGQTEQEYLARFYKENKYFNYVEQSEMDLLGDIKTVFSATGPEIVPNRTEKITDEILG
ncbi:MAG: glycosyltransferase family protein [Candidatus Delongbacteria bacterium]|nr:glycosyltransferase family protein [Candidatus Delongbacteria bacterium]MDD4205581.1 glycosyltransferase family protein [Candidatus Delongbacteria bacterium]